VSYQPPSPYGRPPDHPPPSGRSNKAKFWIGVLLAVPAVIAGPLSIGAAVNLGQVISPDSPLSGMLSGIVSLLLLAGLVTLIVVERTRWVGLGILAGLAILLILAAGACVVLLVSIGSAYS
jgi:uncharacterized membrane protein YhaH (DUF805 family)